MLTALSKAEGLRCAASFVIAAYFSVRLILQDLRALHLDLFSLPSDSDFLRNHQIYYTLFYYATKNLYFKQLYNKKTKKNWKYSIFR
jgi:hypothetical protein